MSILVTYWYELIHINNRTTWTRPWPNSTIAIYSSGYDLFQYSYVRYHFCTWWVMNPPLIHHSLYTNLDMAGHHLYGTLVTMVPWIMSNHTNLCMRWSNSLKSKNHMYLWVRGFILINTWATILLEIYWVHNLHIYCLIIRY